MMLKEFDAVYSCVEQNRKDSIRLLDLARRTEAMLLRETGIYHKDREPGFNCWSHDELNSWYPTPHDAFAALCILRALPEPLEYCI